MGSAGFLLIFAAVNIANIVLAKKTGSLRWVSGIGAFACIAALAALLWQTIQTSPPRILILAVMIVLSLAIEIIYRFLRKRTINIRN